MASCREIADARGAGFFNSFFLLVLALELALELVLELEVITTGATQYLFAIDQLFSSLYFLHRNLVCIEKERVAPKTVDMTDPSHLNASSAFEDAVIQLGVPLVRTT